MMEKWRLERLDEDIHSSAEQGRLHYRSIAGKPCGEVQKAHRDARHSGHLRNVGFNHS
jgi:hypothetical protein